jgi:hypothetical protein
MLVGLEATIFLAGFVALSFSARAYPLSFYRQLPYFIGGFVTTGYFVDETDFFINP